MPLAKYLLTCLFIFALPLLAQTPSGSEPPPKLEEDIGGLIEGISGHGLFQSTGGRGAAPAIAYSGWYAPQNNPGETHFNLGTGSFTAYRSTTDQISFYALASEFHISSPPLLPSGVQVPGDLGRMELGTRYSHVLGEHSFLGGAMGFGSASDRPLNSSYVDTYSASGFYGFASSEHSSWVLSLLFSNNNPISNLVPIPGFIYIYRNANFVGMFGFPFASLSWRPVDPWTISASLFGPTANFEAAHGHRRVLQEFIAFRMMEQSYLLQERASFDDRLREVEDRACVGLRFPLLAASLELQGGYAFDRFVGESSDYRLTTFSNMVNSTDLGNSWYVAAAIRLML